MSKTVIGMFLAAVLMIGSAIWVPAQTPPPPPQQKPPEQNQPPQIVSLPMSCPNLEINRPQLPIRDGQTVKFQVNLGVDPKTNVIFNWSISAGTVVSGQGTSAIEVDTTGAGADKTMTTSLLVSGLAPECQYEATSTINVAGPAKKLDEYGTIKDEDETARLDRFIPAVTAREQAYIIVYAGRSNVRGQANTDLRRIRAYLLKAGLPTDRIVTLDGGYREELTRELWLVPVGAEVPKRSPTVNAKEIVFPKPTPAPIKKP